MTEIWGIILAAGSSRRMGTQKMLLPYNRGTILETTIASVLGSVIDHVMVVLGADSDRILKSISHLPVAHCYNKNHPDGMLSSVICGIHAVPSGCRAVVILPGDQPEIPSSIINRLIDSYKISFQGIVVPVSGNRRGHPILVDVKYRQQITALDPTLGLRALLQQYPGDVLEVQVNDPGILLDIDNRVEYKEALGKYPK